MLSNGAPDAQYDDDETTAFITDLPAAVQDYLQPFSRVRTRPMGRKMLSDLCLACKVPEMPR